MIITCLEMVCSSGNVLYLLIPGESLADVRGVHTRHLLPREDACCLRSAGGPSLVSIRHHIHICSVWAEMAQCCLFVSFLLKNDIRRCPRCRLIKCRLEHKHCYFIYLSRNKEMKEKKKCDFVLLTLWQEKVKTQG